MDNNKALADFYLKQINQMRNVFYKENGFFPDTIKMYEGCVKLLVAYNKSLILNFETEKLKTVFGMQIEEIEYKYIHVYKKGC